MEVKSLKLREYIFRSIAVFLFILAGVVYILMTEGDNNSIILNTRPDRIERNENIASHDYNPQDNNRHDDNPHDYNSNDDSAHDEYMTDENRKTFDEAETGEDNISTRLPEQGNGRRGEGLTDINHADMTELMLLPGIGEVKADAIINYRNENGSFASIEELMNVPGIKEATFNKIKDLICVNIQGS